MNSRGSKIQTKWCPRHLRWVQKAHKNSKLKYKPPELSPNLQAAACNLSRQIDHPSKLLKVQQIF